MAWTRWWLLVVLSMLVLSAAQSPSTSSYMDYAHKKEDSRAEHEWPGLCTAYGDDGTNTCIACDCIPRHAGVASRDKLVCAADVFG